MKLYTVFFAILVWVTSTTEAFARNLPEPSSGSVQRISDFYSKYVPTRNVDIWLPEGYSNKNKYDVLYMHDGQMLFDAQSTWNNQEWKVDEVAAKLMEKDNIKPFIVVGIWNSGETRYPEYFPQKVYDGLSWLDKVEVKSKLIAQSKSISPIGDFFFADDYIQFLAEELIPFIENNFSVNKGQAHRYLAGSSMGGLISWYTLMERPDLFAGAACLSTHWPGMYDVDNPIPEAFEAYFKANLSKLDSHKLYFDLGDQTLDALYPPLQKRIDVILQQQYNQDNWQSEFFPGHQHDETSWASRLHLPLSFLFQK